MKNKILLVVTAILILSGCSVDSMLKRSANNKLIDTKGFHGSKRRPLYNKKYIDRAKINISQNDYDEEDDDEDEFSDERIEPSVRNRYMYRDMIEDDLNAKRTKKSKKRAAYSSRINGPDRYQDIAHARDIARDNSSESDAELRKELSEIKSMLSSARKDLTKYRCPVEKAKEQPTRKNPAPSKKLSEQLNIEHQGQENKYSDNPAKKAGPTHLDSTNISAPTPPSSRNVEIHQTPEGYHIEIPQKPQNIEQPQVDHRAQQDVAYQSNKEAKPAPVYVEEPSHNNTVPTQPAPAAPTPIPAAAPTQQIQSQLQQPVAPAPVPVAAPLNAPQTVTQASNAEVETRKHPPQQIKEDHADENTIPALPQFPHSSINSGTSGAPH